MPLRGGCATNSPNEATKSRKACNTMGKPFRSWATKPGSLPRIPWCCQFLTASSARSWVTLDTPSNGVWPCGGIDTGFDSQRMESRTSQPLRRPLASHKRSLVDLVSRPPRVGQSSPPRRSWRHRHPLTPMREAGLCHRGGTRHHDAATNSKRESHGQQQ